MTLIIWQTPHFQNCVFERRHFFSPDRRSKVVKYAKNYPLDAMIVLAKHETFLFFPWNWMIFLISRWNPNILIIFYLFITSFLQTRIIQPHTIIIFVYTDLFWAHSCIKSAIQYSVQTYLFVVIVCVVIIIVDVDVAANLSSSWKVQYQLNWGKLCYQCQSHPPDQPPTTKPRQVFFSTIWEAKI